MAKPKLHEVLAVEADAAGQYRKILNEAEMVFRKGSHFLGYNRTLTMFDDARKGEEDAGKEARELATTVPDKLKYVQKAIVRYIDVVMHKESTNQVASADILVDGETLATAVPATMLLGLETKLKEIRNLYDAIPTLDLSTKWVRDDTLGENVWVTQNDETALKGEKTIKPMVLYAATKEHPAQVEKLSDTINVGIYRKKYFSGSLSPKEKSDLLGKIDTLIAAVKKARQRANSTEVVKKDIGQTLMDFINKP